VCVWLCLCVVTAGSGFLLENPFGSQCGADVDQSTDSQELQLWGYGSTSRIAIAACTYEKKKDNGVYIQNNI